MVKRKFISDVLSVDFLSRLFGNQGTILARQSLFDGKIIIFNLLFVTIIIKKNDYSIYRSSGKYYKMFFRNCQVFIDYPRNESYILSNVWHC